METKKAKFPKDTEISREYNIPISTIQDFKKAPEDNWRYKIYCILKGKCRKIRLICNNKDTTISRKYGMSVATLQDWKNRPDNNWRKKIYDLIKG